MKYFLSLCCIIKDERYLEEFIIYYRILGVEHFYIYDNDSNISISNRLSNKYYKNMCTIIYFPGKAQQFNAYNHYLKNYGSETKWAIIVDADEYILPKNKLSIRDFLKDYNDYHAIGINWVMFGTSFHESRQDGYIIDKYRYNEGIQDKHIKTICRPEFVNEIINPHHVNLKYPNKYVDPYKRVIDGPFNTKYTTNIIQINHYWTRSKQDMDEKIKRGRAPTTEKRIMPDNIHSLYNKVIDNLICDKYLNIMIEVKKNNNLKF
jgi:hypothetical protein